MKAVEVAKTVHPGMHFHRIVPPLELTENVWALDKDLAKIGLMKENVKQYMRHDKEMRKKFDETMNKLFSFTDGRTDDVLRTCTGTTTSTSQQPGLVSETTAPSVSSTEPVLLTRKRTLATTMGANSLEISDEVNFMQHL